MAVICYALPILPGQTDAARAFQAELDSTGHRARYDELNRQAQVKRHMEWVEPSSIGDLLVVFFETDAPEKLVRAFGDDDYDGWWRARVERIHGFDPATGGVVPELVFSWES